MAAKLYDHLEPLWDELSRTTPTMAEGAEILVEEARDYEGDLLRGPMVVRFDRFWTETGAEVRNSAMSAADRETLTCMIQASRLALGPAHPIGRLLENVAAFTATR